MTFHHSLIEYPCQCGQLPSVFVRELTLDEHVSLLQEHDLRHCEAQTFVQLFVSL
jgi:hypothetical protein